MTPSEALTFARERLLAERGPHGHWEGELSTSALSTATAAFALALVDRERGDDAHAALIAGGLDWLARNQNADGGWGDTTVSFSNISTTALCWAALGLETREERRPVIDRAEAWLAREAGGLEPETLARAITARYGKDRTFSVPILTMCALAGRLGEGRKAWSLFPALPFELAAFPHRWLKHLRLPVVSYALPALIAIGQVQHHRRPSAFLPARWMRAAARARTLNVLRSLQPSTGGFLEATPLTAFVTMSLAGCGQARHPVVDQGIKFLAASVRPDGSWPIDTNLATWVTTLAVNALAESGPLGQWMSAAEINSIREWLLGQQYKEVHPFTNADPGGWAWTDLPGGVPDADDTAGALLALRHLGPIDDRARAAAAAGVRWLLDLQNRDGGIPTFCKGWGILPFDRSGADLTAHALRAWEKWYEDLPVNPRKRIMPAKDRAIDYLCRSSVREDGSWLPLWFGNQHSPSNENSVYGTARSLMGLCAWRGSFDAPEQEQMERSADFLREAEHSEGGWGGARGVAPSIEETSVAIHAWAEYSRPRAEQVPAIVQREIEKSAKWLARAIEAGGLDHPSPIGFYFANLWYYEKMYPICFAVSALGSAMRIESQSD